MLWRSTHVGFLLVALSLAPVCARAQAAKAQEDTQQQAEGAERVRALLEEGVRALQAEQWEEAEQRFRQATQILPGMAPAWLGLSEALRGLERPLDALDAARKALEAGPELSAAAFAVARSLVEVGSREEALVVLERARELDPESVDAQVLSALVLRELGRAEEARDLLLEAWQRGLRSPVIAEQLAFLHLATGDPAAAEEVARAGLAAAPEQAGLKLALGFALAADPERRQEAPRWLGQALDAGVRDPGRVRLELGGVLLDLGRASEALTHLEEAARLLPDNPAVHYRLSAARRALGDEAGALRARERFEALSAAESTGSRTDKELGIALNEIQKLAADDRLDDALHRIDDVLSIHPDEARAHALRAKILYSLGRRLQAEAAIVRARELDPGRAEFHYLEGLFLMVAKRFQAAEAALRRALALDEDLALAEGLLAGALVKQDRPEEAIEHFQRALELGNDAPEVRLGYAGALESLGRDEEAKEQMQAYERLRRDHD